MKKNRDNNHEHDKHDHDKDAHDNPHKDRLGQGCFSPSGACIPVVPGTKHKLSREYKLAQVAERVRMPSTIAAGTMHMARRFLHGKKAANPLERAVFTTLRRLPRDILSCTVDAFEAVPPDQRNRLFAESLLVDLNQPLDAATLTTAFAEEIKQRVGIQVFGDPQALESERPGLVRLFQPNSEIPPSQVIICTIAAGPLTSEPLRTAEFTPPLNLGSYRREEFQLDCKIIIGEVEPDCQVLTANCPGRAIAIDALGNIQCMRVLDISAGDSVVLEGVNFFSVDAKVRFTDKQTGIPVRDVDAFVFGDIDTPLQDEAGQLINDCRVKDRLTFTIPEDLPSALYAFHVIVPNITGDPVFGPELVSDQEFINVIPPATARFEIVIEQIHCKEETSPEWLGSDELGMHTMAAAFDTKFKFINLPAVKLSPNGQSNEPSFVQEQTFREENLDSGSVRDDNPKLVFTHDQPILAMLLCVLGDEIDSEEAYQEEITGWTEIYLDVLKKELEFVFSPGGVAGISGILAAIVKYASVTVAAVVAAIAAAITLAIDLVIALWAPADPLIRDAIALTVNDLDALTNISVPAPDPFSPAVGFPIRVNVNMTVPPVKLATEYHETREYITTPEQDSRYEVTYRYNRVA